MAGDWIKVEHATATKPEVFQMAEEIGASPDEIVGLVVKFWVWVDQQMSEKCPKIFFCSITFKFNRYSYSIRHSCS